MFMTKRKLRRRMADYEKAVAIIWNYQTDVLSDICGADEGTAKYACLNRRYGEIHTILIAEFLKAMLQQDYRVPHKDDMPFYS